MNAIRGYIQEVERTSGSRHYKQYDEADKNSYHRQTDDDCVPCASNLSKRYLCGIPRWRCWRRAWIRLGTSARYNDVRLCGGSHRRRLLPGRCCQQHAFRCRLFSGPRRGKFFKPRLLGRRSRRTEVQIIHHRSRVLCRHNHLKQTK